ncbi:MAG: VWA domain-containing protein [Spirochaetaceae bacterium]|nr:VWA domain-containing protein [Spirochaetaceae bacterium]
MNSFLIQHFEKIQNLKFLYIIPIIIVILIYHFYRRYPAIVKLAGARGSGEKSLFKDGGLRIRYVLASFFFVTFLACVIAAFAAPRLGRRLVRELRRGADIVLAYDISRSMEAKDAGPEHGDGQTRLGRALELGRILILSSMEQIQDSGVVMPADIHIRYALSIGKGGGYLAIPLTSDTEALLSMLSFISPASVNFRGTNLESLLDASRAAFSDNFETAKIIVLFSDGEELTGALSNAARRAKDEDITLFAVCVGSREGAAISADGLDAVTTFARPETLAAAAALTGGELIDGNAGSAVQQLITTAESSGESSWNYREEAVPIWHLFLLAGLFALLLSHLCGKRIRVIS